MIAAIEIFRTLPRFRMIGESRFECCCPVHSEHNPSLHGQIKGSKLVVICRSCGASGNAVRLALGLPWAAFFSGGKLDRHELRRLRLEAAEREKQAKIRELTLAKIYRELGERDAILALDWTGYDGPEFWDMMARLYRDYDALEWEVECLRSSEEYAFVYLQPAGKPIAKLPVDTILQVI